MLKLVNVHVLSNDQNGNPVAGSRVSARLNQSDVDADFGYIAPETVKITLGVDGTGTLRLWPNALGATQSQYEISISNPDTGHVLRFYATIPNLDCNLHEVANLPPYQGKSDGQLAVDAAIEAANAAVVPAQTAATAAATSAGNAATSASAASGSATNAASSATTATTKAGEAAASASAASTSASNAATSAGSVGTSAQLAQDWATKTTGEVVTGQGYGAKKYALDSAASAAAALDAANQAAAGQINADWTETNPLTKAYIQHKPSLAAVATSGAYADLTGKLTFAAVATSGAYADLTGRPSLAAVATAGTYSSLTGLPTIPSTTSQLTNNSGFITAAGAPVQSVAGRTGTVVLAKDDVGLGNVDNTADTAKPVSTAQQAALNLLASKAELAEGSGSSLVTFTQAVAGTEPLSVQKKLRLEPIRVEEFPAVVADGVANDGPAIRAAQLACQVAGRQLCFGGVYAFDYILSQDAVYNSAMHCDNATFYGVATTATKAMIQIVNCVGFHITGNYTVHGADNPNYEMGLDIKAQTGTSQACSRITLGTPTFRNLKIGMGIGRYNVDYQCSEISVFGAQFFKCPTAVYLGGLNTGVDLVGCNPVSEPNAAFPGAPEYALYQEGGFVRSTGGSLFANPSALRGIMFAPCAAASGNVYGTLAVSGQMEMNCALILVDNPRGLSSPVSTASSVTFNNCTGYCGAPAATDFILVADSTYAGVINITANNWYSTVARTGYNVASASALARIVVDKTSFGQNFKNWLGGVFGGRVLHDVQPVASVYGLGVTYSAGAETVLKFLNTNTTNELQRYGGGFDPATGIYTVPAGGFARLIVSIGLVGSGAASSGYITLLKNGAAIYYGPISSFGSGVIGALNATLYGLNAGDTITAKIFPNGGTLTCDAGPQNFIQISGATA